MSGGSFNYLFCAVDRGSMPDEDALIDMHQVCVEAGADQAAKEVRNLIEVQKDFVAEFERMKPLLRAIEWAVSGDILDSGIAPVAEGLQEPAETHAETAVGLERERIRENVIDLQGNRRASDDFESGFITALDLVEKVVDGADLRTPEDPRS